MVTYSIDPDRLAQMGRDLRETYASAAPFPHIVIDDFFPTEIVDAALSEFPKPSDVEWQTFENQQERKLASNREQSLSPTARQLIWEMNSQVFLEFLQGMTGIQNLMPDPQLSGGGMHQIKRGGKLGVHVDFNRHGEYQLDRRLNALLYLNKDWSEDFGGHLELWDRDMQNCVKRVLPLFNRLVVFTTTEESWHGHPNPLNCPEDRTRKSLALYYYTNGRPDEEIISEHSTVFRARPGEKLKQESKPIVIRDFVPPIVMRGIDKLRGR